MSSWRVGRIRSSVRSRLLRVQVSDLHEVGEAGLVVELGTRVGWTREAQEAPELLRLSEHLLEPRRERLADRRIVTRRERQGVAGDDAVLDADIDGAPVIGGVDRR